MPRTLGIQSTRYLSALFLTDVWQLKIRPLLYYIAHIGSSPKDTSIQRLTYIRMITGHSGLYINRNNGQTSGCCYEYWSWQDWTPTGWLHVAFFVCVLIHIMTWANLRERTLVTGDDRCSMTVLAFKGRDCQGTQLLLLLSEQLLKMRKGYLCVLT